MQFLILLRLQFRCKSLTNECGFKVLKTNNTTFSKIIPTLIIDHVIGSNCDSDTQINTKHAILIPLVTFYFIKMGT